MVRLRTPQLEVELGLARGKAKHDKREAEKTRDWNREKARIMRDKKAD